MSDEDDYKPAERPAGPIPGDKHVRFEREGDYEQSMWGGGAQDVEASILASTERNIQIIGWMITGVEDVVGDLGQGTLQSIQFQMQRGGQTTVMKITGIGLKVEIR